jgi:putative flippase GtrA
VTRKTIAWLLGHPFMRFGTVGVVGFTVDTAVLAFNTDVMGFHFLLARAISILVAMCFTYIGNRYLTFAARRAHGAAGIAREWAKFVGANSVGAIVNYGVSALVVFAAPAPFNNKYVGQVCGVAVGMVFNFTLSARLVFRHSGPPSPIL